MNWINKKFLIVCGSILLLISTAARPVQRVNTRQSDLDDWRKQWGVEEGFSIEIDTTGYIFPSSIAFVPNPGDAPNDPLYFVSELRGTIKVVSNNRSVHIFAEDFLEKMADRGLEDIPDEFGITGICLDPEHGYIFATVTNETENGRFNDIVRFQTQPNTFGLEYSFVKSIGYVFTGVNTGFSHVIGPCQAQNGMLYVGVGDGYNATSLPIDLDIPAGKILRMTFEGEPVTDNPFYDEGAITPQDYVWAYGFRNPFGLYVDGENVFVGDNGDGVDRFLNALKGSDYLWDGSDLSIGSKNLYSFSPTIAPTQLDLYSSDQDIFPSEYNKSFFMGMAGKLRGVINIPYAESDVDEMSVPRVFLEYLDSRDGRYAGTVAGIGFGPDGLYFAPIALNDVHDTAVYRISYDPSNSHPYRPGEYIAPEIILENRKCLGCHMLSGRGGEIGPELTPKKLQARLEEYLNSVSYSEYLVEIDKLSNEMTERYKTERGHLLQLHGKERVWYWVYYRLLEPRFDNPNAAMPNPGLNDAQAAAMADFLVGDLKIISQDNGLQDANTTSDSSLADILKSWWQKLSSFGDRETGLAFFVGILFGITIVWAIIRRRKG